MLHKRPEFPLECSISLRNLIQKCWSQRPALRSSFDDICSTLVDLMIQVSGVQQLGSITAFTARLSQDDNNRHPQRKSVEMVAATTTTNNNNKWHATIAVYPCCIHVTLMSTHNAQKFENELHRELWEANQVCKKNRKVWLGDVCLGSLLILTPNGHCLILIWRTGTSVICHNLETGKREPQIDPADITNTLVDMFFSNFWATIWYWAAEILCKLSGFSKGKILMNWKQALFGQGLEGEEWKSHHTVYVWNLLRRTILTEIWWLYNCSLVEDTSKVSARYLVQQIWLSLRLYILLEWSQVIKEKDEKLAETFKKRWLTNGFARIMTRNWVLWIWEEPLLISMLNF
ncbi:hypothetical protein SELMODRAFT_405141 [Selaginella moellendorffii]|uniref:Uncharacterized protein n=1 Tax=Selaginella moellendorffii TaxID=88036 RepID=D8QYJ2_SELML|nr:hypothetical protein SELMODRAFT_405141 [Selaginella moellendorffii]